MTDLKKKLEEAKAQAANRDAKDHAAQDAALDGSDQLKKDLAEMTELAKRTMADLQNLRRRNEEERGTLVKMANLNLIAQILPIVDNLDRAITHSPGDEWAKGIEMSLGQLHNVLENFGVKRMECVGQPFNPDLHEALTQGPGPANTVVEELEKGYLLGDRVIRHAKVKVGDGDGLETS